ncbi:hypothetical protein [Natronomonas sp.]|uniref:hypothetical protein n=1 Tax=Natronomonas sp. TaxID=2184060 RepID=UPI0026230A5C|nr:hypothetical protein [Natronomonas sp.]
MIARRTVLLGVAVSTAGCARGSFGGLGGGGLGADERGEIVETYDAGVQRANEGAETRNEGIAAFNDRRYGDATRALSTAGDRYATATERFRTAVEMAKENEVPPATRICEEAATHADAMERSTAAALEGAVAADENEPPDVINGHIETARELQSEAEESTIADPEELLGVLEADG